MYGRCSSVANSWWKCFSVTENWFSESIANYYSTLYGVYYLVFGVQIIRKFLGFLSTKFINIRVYRMRLECRLISQWYFQFNSSIFTYVTLNNTSSNGDCRYQKNGVLLWVLSHSNDTYMHEHDRQILFMVLYSRRLRWSVCVCVKKMSIHSHRYGGTTIGIIQNLMSQAFVARMKQYTRV